MKFSLNIQGNKNSGTAMRENDPAKNEELEMTNANDIQMNQGNSGTLVNKNTNKKPCGLARAGENRETGGPDGVFWARWMATNVA